MEKMLCCNFINWNSCVGIMDYFRMYQNRTKTKQDKLADIYHVHLMHFMLYIKYFNTIHNKKKTIKQQELHEIITSNFAKER